MTIVKHTIPCPTTKLGIGNIHISLYTERNSYRNFVKYLRATIYLWLCIQAQGRVPQYLGIRSLFYTVPISTLDSWTATRLRY